MIQRTADDLVGAFAPRGHAELLSEFAWPLPSTVITELLGVPGQDRERFLGWVHAILGPGAEDPQDIAATFTSVVAYLTELIDGKRGQPAVGANDILSELVTAQERGDQLTGTELRSLSFALLARGFETTSLLLTAPSSGGEIMINGHALWPPPSRFVPAIPLSSGPLLIRRSVRLAALADHQPGHIDQSICAQMSSGSSRCE